MVLDKADPDFKQNVEHLSKDRIIIFFLGNAAHRIVAQQHNDLNKRLNSFLVVSNKMC
jgi:hypothetical protein